MLRHRCLLVSVACLLLSAGGMAAFQRVQGTVNDDKGTARAGVALILTGIETGYAREAVTDAAGRFIFVDIPVGHYTLQAERSGFRTLRLTGITVRVGDALRYSLILEPGPGTPAREMTVPPIQVEATTSWLDTLIGGDTEGVVGALLGGWQINGIVYANSGYPMDYKVPRDTLGTGYTNDRGPARPFIVDTHVVTDGNRVGPTQANFHWTSEYINLESPQGDYYRGFFRGPGYWDVDFSLFKQVKIPWFTGDGAWIQFRVEAFNLFNHTNFTLPGRSFTSSNMGKTFNAEANRQIQLGVKLLF